MAKEPRLGFCEGEVMGEPAVNLDLMLDGSKVCCGQRGCGQPYQWTTSRNAKSREPLYVLMLSIRKWRGGRFASHGRMGSFTPPTTMRRGSRR